MKLFKKVRLTLSYTHPFSARLLIVYVELFLCAVLLSVLMGEVGQKRARIDYCRQMKQNNIVLFHPEDPNQLRFCRENGTVLGTEGMLSLYGDMLTSKINMLVYDSAVLEYLSKEVIEGEWFPEGNYDCDYIVAVPEAMSRSFERGKTYTCQYIDSSEVPVKRIPISFYVCCIIRENVLPNSWVFTVNDSILVGKAVSGKGQEFLTLSAFARLKNDFLPGEAASLGIQSADKKLNQMEQSFWRDLGQLPVFFILIGALFLTGFLSNYYLTIEENSKRIAILFLCGATAGNALAMQMIHTAFSLMFTIGLAVPAACFIEQRGNLSVSYESFWWLAAAALVLSGILAAHAVWRNRRQGPLEVIRRKFES